MPKHKKAPLQDEVTGFFSPVTGKLKSIRGGTYELRGSVLVYLGITSEKDIKESAFGAFSETCQSTNYHYFLSQGKTP